MRNSLLTKSAAAVLVAVFSVGLAACDDDVEAELDDLGSAVEEDLENGAEE